MAESADELVPTRATLIQRLKNWQDESSWEDFFNTYWKLIYDFAVKNGLTPSEAEDVVQETLLAVARSMPGFKYNPEIGSFKAWLFNLTRWRVKDQLRRRNSNAEAAFQEEPTGATRAIERIPDPASENVDAVWDAEWEKNLLTTALNNVKRRVDPQKYQVFDLYVNKNCPAAKVAATFGMPVDQVYLAKHRVTESIKEEVARLRKMMT